jgi:GT2 family glycosyltransferase
MEKPLCSVVLATYNRAHLLARSLACYREQAFPKRDFELVVIDDHSTDSTIDLVKKWADEAGIAYQIVIPGPKNTDWRDCGAILNCGIRAATGRHILLTHPEVMPGRRSVAACVEELERRPGLVYACCKPYYLTPRDQERIIQVDWLREGPLAVRDIPGFYDHDQHADSHKDYVPWVIDSVGKPGFGVTQWESWVFGGCSRATWRALGGMLETAQWGSVDVAWKHRRETLGIGTKTQVDEQTICVHQNHDGPGNVPTPRVMEVWMQELKGVPLSNPDLMRYPAVDNLGW